MNHAALPCGLPFASPSLPCLLSSPAHLSPHPRAPPSMLKSFEAQTCPDSGYFSSRRDSFMWHKRSIHIGPRRTGSLRLPTPWRGRRGPAIPGPANTVVLYTRPLSLCANASVCPREGFTGLRPPARQAEHPALCAAGASVSRPLA